jgi:signal transduction histidine kinase
MGACLLLLASLGYSQQTETDSLVQVTKGRQDTHAVKAFLRLAEITARKNASDAINYCQSAFFLSQKLNYPFGIAKSQFHHSQALVHLNSFELSMQYALNALQGFIQIGDSIMVAKTYSNIGLTYFNVGNQKKAREYQRKAEGIFLRHKAAKGIFMARNNLAMSYDSQDQFDSALYLYQLNLLALDRINNEGYRAITLNNMGFSHLGLKQYETAYAYIYEAYLMKLKMKDEYGLTNSYNNLAHCLIGLKDFEKARQYLDSGLVLCLKLNALDREIENYDARHKLEKERNNLPLALDYLEKVIQLKDSLSELNQGEKTANLEIAYHAEKQKDQIAFLEIERSVASNNRLVLIILLCVMGFALVIASFLAFAQRRNLAMIRSQQNQILENNLELQLKNAQLEESNSEKDGLIGIVAHDLRAPLNRSVALVQLIASAGKLNQDQERYIEMINKVADNGSKLIQDLLEITAYQQGYPRLDNSLFRLQEVMDSVLSGHYINASNKGIALVYDPGQTYMIHSDPNLLGRVIENLLSNAIKFTPMHLDKEVKITLTHVNNEVIISIADQGPGISQEDQKKLFRKFSKLKSRPTGGESSTGLGLAIVKILAEKVGARIELRSEEGKGSEFRIICQLALPEKEDLSGKKLHEILTPN